MTTRPGPLDRLGPQSPLDLHQPERAIERGAELRFDEGEPGLAPLHDLEERFEALAQPSPAAAVGPLAEGEPRRGLAAVVRGLGAIPFRTGHLGLGGRRPFLLLGRLEVEHPGGLGQLAALDPPAAQRLDQALVEHRPEPAQLAIDRLGLLDDPAEDRILLAVLVEEIAAMDRRRLLELAIDPAVPLLEPGGVPGDVVVEQVRAEHLEVQALAGGVGRQQDPDGVIGRVGVERLLDLLPLVERRRTPVDGDPRRCTVGPVEVGLEVPADVGERVVVFGEHDDAMAGPALPRRPAALAVDEHVLVDVFEELLQLLIGLRAGLAGGVEHLAKEGHLTREARMRGVTERGEGHHLGLAVRRGIAGRPRPRHRDRARRRSMPASARRGPGRRRCRPAVASPAGAAAGWCRGACSTSARRLRPRRAAAAAAPSEGRPRRSGPSGVRRRAGSRGASSRSRA